jgi:uncharacterized RDD family membrane protein YckC
MSMISLNIDNKISSSNESYARFFDRVIAMFLDDLILVGCVLVFIFLLAFLRNVSMMAFIQTLQSHVIYSSLVSHVVWILYETVLLSSRKQATFGKSIVGIYVSDVSGKKLTIYQAALRSVLKDLTGSLVSPLIYLLCLLAPRSQTLHDYFAKTVVLDGVPEFTEPHNLI